MAVSTYLELVNKVCRQFNEVELSASTFSTSRGVHSSIKDGVNFSLNQINNSNLEWPFNFIEGASQTLTIGDNFYDFPSVYKSADWDSFYIHKDGTHSTSTVPLKWINKDEFHHYAKARDLNNTTSGIAKPIFVTPWGNRAFAITPVPDKAYIVKYNYYSTPVQLSAHGDSTNVPVEYDHIIILGVMWYTALFKEDVDKTQLAEKTFKSSLKDMRMMLINQPEYMTSGLMNRGQNHTFRDSFDDA